MKHHHHIHNDLNQLDKQPMKLLFPLEEGKFKKYVSKGGDIMLVDNNKHVHVIEIKNRIKKFPDNEIEAKEKIKEYVNDFVNIYPENMLVAIECNDEKILTGLLNYTNAYKDNEFCYMENDLQKPEVIAELKSLPLKPKFQQFLIKDASDYHDAATPSDYAFEQSEQSQNKKEQKKKFIKMNELEVLECFENPSFKVNADLNETKIIYNNTFYARSSN